VPGCGRWGYDLNAADGAGADAGPGPVLAEAPVSCGYEDTSGPVFYVALTGDDDVGDGSVAAPWATINHAIDVIPDGSTVLVEPGEYTETVEITRSFQPRVTIRSRLPYQARLRSQDFVLVIYNAGGVNVEGFDMAHAGTGAVEQLIHIHDQAGQGLTKDITLRNNIVHDDVENALARINNGARNIVVERNVFYNATTQLLHLQKVSNVIVQDNVFFYDADAAAGPNRAGIYVVGGVDPTDHVFIRRNIFANWQGSSAYGFVQLWGVSDSTIENNLILGNSSDDMVAPLDVRAPTRVVVRHNTVAGDLPASVYGLRLASYDGAPGESIQVYNNVWSDPTGTMDEVTRARAGDVASIELDNNLYYNGGNAIPASGSELVDYSDDVSAVLADPKLPAQAPMTLPVWNPDQQVFSGGATDVCQVFTQLAYFGIPAADSRVVGAARADQSPTLDLLGRLRENPSLGALEP